MTLLELMVTLSLSVVLLYSITAAARTSGQLYDVSSVSMDLDARGSRTMQRIVESLRGTRLASIGGIPAPPLCASTIQFSQVTPFLGLQARITDPMQITLEGDEALWVTSPMLPDERRSRWVRGIPALFAGEELNGLDDNGNGITDEPGLYFSRRGTSIQVGLTLVDRGVTRSWTSRVHCRN